LKKNILPTNEKPEQKAFTEKRFWSTSKNHFVNLKGPGFERRFYGISNSFTFVNTAFALGYSDNKRTRIQNHWKGDLDFIR